MFKIKYNPDDTIERYKARLVVQRFAQVHEIDYTKIFTPIIKYELLKVFLAIAMMIGMILIQMDKVGAYFENGLDQNEQPIHMKIPQRCSVS